MPFEGGSPVCQTQNLLSQVWKAGHREIRESFQVTQAVGAELGSDTDLMPGPTPFPLSQEPSRSYMLVSLRGALSIGNGSLPCLNKLSRRQREHRDIVCVPPGRLFHIVRPHHPQCWGLLPAGLSTRARSLVLAPSCARSLSPPSSVLPSMGLESVATPRGSRRIKRAKRYEILAAAGHTGHWGSIAPVLLFLSPLMNEEETPGAGLVPIPTAAQQWVVPRLDSIPCPL